MSAPIVTPQEAQDQPREWGSDNPTGEVHWCEDCQEDHALDLVSAFRLRIERDGLIAACKILRERAATEPERTRAAVIKALRKVAIHVKGEDGHFLLGAANAIENGADW